MIRVLIAEDEPPTMRRIKRMIEQVDPDFAVVAEAADGEEALQKMKEAPCDVLFTDIRMPVVDGLQLMDAVHAQYPDCQIVIISGYQDFSYVTHAVRASAVDYLLKPVSQENMAELMARLKKTYTSQKKDRLTKQLSATINRTAMQTQAGAAQMPEDSRFCVCLFCSGLVPLGDDEGLFIDLSDFEQIPLEDTLREIVPHYGGFTWAFVGNTQAERILIYERAKQPAGVIAAQLHARLKETHGRQISCVCAAESIVLADIGKTIARLRKALLASVAIGEGVFVEMGPEGQETEHQTAYNDHQTAKALADMLQSGRFSVEGTFWNDCTARMERESWTQDRMHSLFISVFAYIEAEKGNTPELAQARSLVKDILSTASSFGDLREGLSGLESLFSVESVEQTDLQLGVAAKVEQYLIDHYPEHITTLTLGAEFSYAPSHLSLLFRKKYDMSPVEYLVKLRLDMAKQLMRGQPKMLVRDIAERVGFKSPHHFSRVFKKYEGVWPTDYHGDGGKP